MILADTNIFLEIPKRHAPHPQNLEPANKCL